MNTNTEKHPNRPHCLYLWFHHGTPVCSEEKSNRECPYPFWKCPVRGQKMSNQMMVTDAVMSDVSDLAGISVRT
ncbi:MAG: hypothetical protein GXY18_04410 [Methanomicrobiales archaeon]|nr:hypothetical protein [Methanomicrobiales archaeon]